MRVAIAALLVVACARQSSELRVFAAASLTEVFQRIAPDASFNFAGSDALATQIREGGHADVYATASARYAEALAAKDLIEDPRVFATNRLVLIVPRDNPARIDSLEDLVVPGVRLAIGAPGVPVGDYARRLLDESGARAALDNVVTEEQDVKGVMGKVAAGEADAGFVYATDVAAAGEDVKGIALPEAGPVRYVIAAVAESENRSAARRFMAHVLGDRGRRALRSAGFGLP